MLRLRGSSSQDNGAWLSKVEIVAVSMVSLHGLEVDGLDGAGSKGHGESEDDSDAT